MCQILRQSPVNSLLDYNAKPQHMILLSRWMTPILGRKDAADVQEETVMKSGPTSYGGLWHHGGNVLWPVQRDWASHLDVWGVTSCCERRNRGIMDNLLRLHLISHIPLETKEKHRSMVEAAQLAVKLI